MKTALVWNEVEELKYAIVDGDLSKFEGTYINCGNADPELEAKLSELVYDEEYNCVLEFVTIDVFAQAIRDGAVAVECGFLP